MAKASHSIRFLLAAALLAALVPALARGDGPRSAPTALSAAAKQGAGASAYSLTIVGGDGPNEVTIGLSADQSEYVVRANGPIAEVASCRNPAGDATELRCPAGQISSFVVRSTGGNDTVNVTKAVEISSFLFGGEGADDLSGGDGPDKLVGSEGADTLTGCDGPDFIYGSEGDDSLFGGDGNDFLRGGAGRDDVTGGAGRNDVED
jgi:Ca2+-binding RTX toxin-like protein